MKTIQMEGTSLDRTVLHREVAAIFEQAAGNFPALDKVEQQLETMATAGCRGDVQKAAEPVIALLGLDLDDLRKAALLSVMVRLIGKRRFDPVASYILEKRATYATSPG